MSHKLKPRTRNNLCFNKTDLTYWVHSSSSWASPHLLGIFSRRPHNKVSHRSTSWLAWTTDYRRFTIQGARPPKPKTTLWPLWTRPVRSSTVTRKKTPRGIIMPLLTAPTTVWERRKPSNKANSRTHNVTCWRQSAHKMLTRSATRKFCHRHSAFLQRRKYTKKPMPWTRNVSKCLMTEWPSLNAKINY